MVARIVFSVHLSIEKNFFLLLFAMYAPLSVRVWLMLPFVLSVCEGVTPLVGVDFLDNSMLETDVETDQSKSERIKYSIDYSY